MFSEFRKLKKIKKPLIQEIKDALDFFSFLIFLTHAPVFVLIAIVSLGSDIVTRHQGMIILPWFPILYFGFMTIGSLLIINRIPLEDEK